MKIVRARDMRSFGKKGQGMGVFLNLTGVLFIRTVERSERIYQAMLSRGFEGTMVMPKKYRISSADIIFAVLSLAAISICRRYNLASILGVIIVGKI